MSGRGEATSTDESERAAVAEEVSLAHARRLDSERDGRWFVLKPIEEAGELVRSYPTLSGKASTNRA